MEVTMATKITVVLEDDLDGGPADETLRLGLRRHRIRDRPDNKRQRIPSATRPYIKHAHKAKRGQRRRPVRTTASRERSENIRSLAKGWGIAVSDRGRIPASVVEQYQAATARA